MADEELDLEADWKDIRPVNTGLILVSDRPSDIKSQLLMASEKASFELAQRFLKNRGDALTIELLTQIVSEGVKVFMEKWLEGLRGQDLAGLIEIVLEGQRDRLTPSEMLGFVRALPDTLLEKIAQTAIGSGTGIHALMGVEAHRRSGGPDYTLTPSGGSVQVNTVTSRGEMSFNLFDRFTLDTHE